MNEEKIEIQQLVKNKLKFIPLLNNIKNILYEFIYLDCTYELYPYLKKDVEFVSDFFKGNRKNVKISSIVETLLDNQNDIVSTILELY